MLDQYKRDISYLRISVTDRCNLKCLYCVPEKGIELMNHEDILSFDEIKQVVQHGVRNGIKKVRFTGGEPLVRPGIVNLVKIINDIEGIEELVMTSNGVLMKKYANALKNAGLNRVNISLDTMNPERYRHITRGGDINKVLSGIDAAIEAGLKPVKINCVIMKDGGNEDALNVKAFADSLGIEIRFIHEMNLETGEFSKVIGGSGGDCKNCNRLRLTANGNIKPCLFNNIVFNIREYGVDQAFKLSVDHKPLSGGKTQNGKFYNLGG